MGWKKIIDESFRFKVHYVSEELLEDISYDLESREAIPETDKEDIDIINFETGGGYGMRSMCWPSFKFELEDGRVLELDADVVGYTLAKLKKNSVRVTAQGKRYIKLHSRFSCLVVSEKESIDLIAQLTEAVPKALSVADEFGKKQEAALNKLEEKGHIHRVRPKFNKEDLN